MLRGAVPGVSGGIASWFIIDSHLTIAGVALVTAVSCVFGMLSSLSRVKAAQETGLRYLFMNAGAVWLASFVLASSGEADIPRAVMIGLGVGLAGTKILEIFERGIIGTAERMFGAKPVMQHELDKRLGDERDQVQSALAEVKLEVKPITKKMNEVEQKVDQIKPVQDGVAWDDPAT